jgi:L-ascorbate metabolism protein UlaG (beta-lactamase superfamily)
MLIEWYGHSCFRVTLENGTKIVMDPFDNTVGYEQPNIEADVVLESHQHSDHNCTETIRGNYRLITEPGEYGLNGLEIKGIPCFHDKENGRLRGKNIIFVIKAEGISLCHMGDQGYVPSERLLNEIGNVDILMIPVGGTFTIDAGEAFETIEKMQPNITLPMHYRTMHTDMNIEGVHEFLELASGHYDIARHGANSITVTKDQLKKRSRIIVLEYI